MSGETNRDDELDFDDFIIEDAPVADNLADLFADKPKQAQPGRAAGAPDESDILFGEQSVDNPTEIFGRKKGFNEDHGEGWKGAELDPSEMGIPVESMMDDTGEEFALEAGEQDAEPQHAHAADRARDENEIELVNEASELLEQPLHAEEEADTLLDGSSDELDDVFATEEEPPADEAAAAELDPDAEPAPEYSGGVDQFIQHSATEAKEMQAEEDAQFGDEQVTEGDLLAADPDYVDPAAEQAAAVYEADQEALSTSQFDDTMVETTVDALPEHEVVVAAPSRRGRVFSMFASMAAALLLLAGGAVVVVKPDWFGLRLRPQAVEVVQVARPDSKLEVAPPQPVQVAVAQPTPPVTPTQPEVIQPPTDPVAQTDPVPTQPSDPQPPTPPTDPVVVAPQPPIVPVMAPPGVIVSDDQPKTSGQLIVAGKDLLIGEHERARDTDNQWNVVLGSRAVAVLRNGNFFIGNVKNVSNASLTLRMDQGEITLVSDEIKLVTTLGASEFAQLQKAQTGSLKLANSNRLTGTILESVIDDHVILEMKSDRVMVPRSEIEQIEEGTQGSDVRVGSSPAEDEWLRRLATDRLRTEVPQAPEPAPAPGTEPTPEPAPNAAPPKAPAKAPANTPKK